MHIAERLVRHARITMRNYRHSDGPPFLILFINSICNQKCDHCFYWRSLNSKDDLSRDEIFALSRSLGRIETLNLSGGEPFLRPEFGEICRQFIQHNKVRQIYVPTNGYFTDRTIKQVTETLKEPELDLFVAEISLDGLGEFHNKFRGSPGLSTKPCRHTTRWPNFRRAIRVCASTSISTATDVNMDEIRKLTSFLYERCPKMDHHNLAMIRGDRKNPSLHGPGLEQYRQLYDYVRRLWSDRERNRYGSIVEPMLQWAKTRTATAQTQVVPCRAGILNAVVYANGDVSVCENHGPLGNLRQKSFPEIWKSPEAAALRESIAAKNCYCTNEVFLYPSITFQPTQLVRAMVGAKVWRNATPLRPDEKVTASIEDGTLSPDHARLVSIQVNRGQ